MTTEIEASAKETTSDLDPLDLRIQRDKLFLIGKLSGALVHDLNNPLTTILIYAESLYKGSDEDSMVNEQSMEILEGARRCRSLIKDFLTFVRRPRAKKNSLMALDDLLRSVHLITKHLLNMAKIQFELKLAPDLKPAFIRSGELEQVLVSLILHVLENSPGPQSFRIATKETEDTVVIELRAEHDSFHLEDPGLKLCEEILVQMNALLYVPSEGDKSSRLEIRLASLPLEEMSE